MKYRFIIIILLCLAYAATSVAQRVNPEQRKNSVVKQWIVRGEGSTPELDNVTTYDELGRKIEEIEYASYGQKDRVVYEYDGNSNRCIRQIEYNDKNKVVRIRKIEYNADGTRKAVYNYTPNGKLKYTKTYEYSTR